jgi:hypothetical protein
MLVVQSALIYPYDILFLSPPVTPCENDSVTTSLPPSEVSCY